MKLIITIYIVLISSFSVLAQSASFAELIRKGNSYHDNGQYEQALEQYKKALKYDSVSGIVHYEIAYTLLAMQKYDEASEYCKKVINLDSKQQQGAYLLWGSALNLGGKPQEAVKVYLEAMMKFRGLHQLHYNLALAYFEADNLVKSEEALIHSLKMKPNHINSHILLAKIMMIKQQYIKALLSLNYILYLDSQSNRSAEISDLLHQTIKVACLSLTENDSIENSDVFIKAKKQLVDKFNISDTSNQDKLFAEMECHLFAELESIAQNNIPIWSDLYATTFHDLYKSGHCESFSYVISRPNASPAIEVWIRTNQGKMQSLQSWIGSHQPPAKVNHMMIGKSVFK